MSSNSTPPDNTFRDNPPDVPREDRLRRLLTRIILIGIVFNIISWGGAAGFLVLRQSGASIDWGGAGGLPNIQLDGPRIRQTVPSDATIPPTPIDITSVGQPTGVQPALTATATRPVEPTPIDEADTPPATPTHE